MRKFVQIVTVFFGLCLNAYACQVPNGLSVKGNERQHEQVCKAYKKAVYFFEKYGYAINDELVSGSVIFESRVMIPEKDSKGNPTFNGGVRVLGLFDRGSGILRITDEKEPWIRQKKRTYFKLQYTPQLYESVLLHEMIHLLSKQLYLYSDYGHAQEEYIAYVAQIESLPEHERERVLRSCAAPECVFADEMNINDIVHFADPHAFGVMSWRHFTSNEGGRMMLDRIYSGAFKPINLSDLP